MIKCKESLKQNSMIDSKIGSVRRGVFKAFAQTGAAIISSFPN